MTAGTTAIGLKLLGSDKEPDLCNCVTVKTCRHLEQSKCGVTSCRCMLRALQERQHQSSEIVSGCFLIRMTFLSSMKVTPF